MQQSITPRKRLEIIVDTCSMGDKKMIGISKLLNHCMSKPARIFEEYRIVIPLQLGTEARQRMFPEFLEKEFKINPKSNGLDAFVARHTSNVRIVETQSSRAFTFFYAQKAAAVLRNDPALKPLIIKHAKDLAQRYGVDDAFITTGHLRALLAHIETLGSIYEPRVRNAQEQLTTYHERNAANGKAPPLHREMKQVQRKTLARTWQSFFETCSMTDKLVLQALYSCRQVYARVGKDNAFSNFRTDLGERAIEEYLFTNRAETDKSNVTLVVSEDRGARGSIQRLRGQSNNTIFVIGSFGLGLALKQLGLIPYLTDIVQPELMHQVRARKAWTQQKRENGVIIGMNDINEPAIEAKWASRLVQVVEQGHWNDKRWQLSSDKNPAPHR